MTKSRYYITTAIDYANSTPHVGTAFEKVGADALARWKRLSGVETFFLMGNDEHSANVEKKARAEGLQPRAYCDRMEEKFKAVWSKLELSYDRFIRTSWPKHEDGVREIYRRIVQAGDAYLGTYRGLYCVGCEEYKKEADLVDGVCPNHKTPPQKLEEQNYFFRLSQYRDRVRRHIEANPSFIEPSVRRNEVLAWLDRDLDDISITRQGLSWGVPIPDDPQHVIYIWFDALINYVTGAGFPHDPATFESTWPADLHVIGKDITRFHAIVWPAMLMSAGLPLPTSIFAHGFVYVSGQKISKSLGTSIDPVDLATRFGADPLRYFLLREINFHDDGDFSLKKFADRYNADLANDLGNLVQRTTSMVQRYQGGVIESKGTAPAPTSSLKERVLGSAAAMAPQVETLQFHNALATLWEGVRRANLYVEETAPWALAKSGQKEALAGALYHSLESIRVIAIMLQPFMPGTSAAIFARLGLAASAPLSQARTWDVLPAGGRISAGDPLFPRLAFEE